LEPLIWIKAESQDQPTNALGRCDALARNIATTTGTAMSDRFEDRLDVAFETRRQRRMQRDAEQAQSENAIHESHAELERRQARFCTEIRSLVEKAVARANQHLAKRPEKCRLLEVSGYFTGPLYRGGAACNPIAYQLQSNGRDIGETLIIELTHDGIIEAFLGPFPPAMPEGHTARLELGWTPVPLNRFNSVSCSELLIRFVNAVTAQWPLRHRPDQAGATPIQ
jgi:hypothetical protein